MSLPTTHRAVAALSPGSWDVISIPTPEPNPGEVSIKVEYTALIPFDTYQSDLGYIVDEWPIVLGFSASGTIAKVGEGVPGLKVGDRVTAFTFGKTRTRGLQEYTTQHYSVVGKVPDNVPLEGAATIPDNFVTAFYTLFSECGLEWPHLVPVNPPKDADKAILVYGAGASSGQYTVQLLHVAGYTNVLATASPAHHAHLKALGAKEVFDYRSPTLAQDIEKYVGGKVDIIVDCIATETTIKAIGGVLAPDGFFAILLPIKGGDKVRPEGAKEEKFYFDVPDHLKQYVPGTARRALVRTFLYQNNTFLKENLMPKILPDLLAKGLIKPNPVRLFAEGTLKERAAVALDLLRHNKISGEKVVIKLD
uniref:Enoyl reductase (ER) domain-containing protein n=1 Tax=Schizophyllum commune (strain H4-8 / FGSC 9210) TaxID=578458 RepID=D8Q781_SCHCM